MWKWMKKVLTPCESRKFQSSKLIREVSRIEMTKMCCQGVKGIEGFLYFSFHSDKAAFLNLDFVRILPNVLKIPLYVSNFSPMHLESS